MKFSAVFALCLLAAAPSFADTVIVRNSGTSEPVVRELPGNATVVTDGGGGGVYIENDRDDVLTRAIIGNRYDGRGYYNSAPVGGVSAACAGADRTVEYNRCMREAIRDQKKLQRKYND